MPGTSSSGRPPTRASTEFSAGSGGRQARCTFSFPANASFYGSGYGDGEASNAFGVLNGQQQSAVRSILQAYSSFANLTFLEIAETATQHADLRFAKSNAPGTAWAYYPSINAAGGELAGTNTRPTIARSKATMPFSCSEVGAAAVTVVPRPGWLARLPPSAPHAASGQAGCT